MPKKAINTKRILNRRATHDYELGDSLEVGIILSGAETKALRMGHGQLQGAYVTIKDNDLYLINATISGTNGVPISEDDQTRSRKLLAKRTEINRLIALKEQGNTIIPLEIRAGSRYIKLKIAVGKGKKMHDKRSVLKKREQSRDIEFSLKRGQFR